MVPLACAPPAGTAAAADRKRSEGRCKHARRARPVCAALLGNDNRPRCFSQSSETALELRAGRGVPNTCPCALVRSRLCKTICRYWLPFLYTPAMYTHQPGPLPLRSDPRPDCAPPNPPSHLNLHTYMHVKHAPSSNSWPPTNIKHARVHTRTHVRMRMLAYLCSCVAAAGRPNRVT